KHERSCAHLEEQGGRKHAGIPVEQMQAAIRAGVGPWFLARVDDSAVELDPFKQIVVDVIGALADLKVIVRSWPHEVASEFGTGCGSDTSGAHIKLAQSEKGQQR